MSTARDILITDVIYVSEKHERLLQSNGFRAVRLSRHCATESELAKALAGKVGYILGGAERLTARALEAATDLRAVVYASSNWRAYIPAYKEAARRGISIANCPGGDARAVAEYALALLLTMLREVLALGRTGNDEYKTTKSLEDVQVGIIGLGASGTALALMLVALGVKRLCYFSRSRRPALESCLGIEFMDLSALLKQSDAISIHADRSAGTILGRSELATLRDGGVIINVAYPWAVDISSLAAEIRAGRLRAAFDAPPRDLSTDLLSIPPDRFFWSKEYVAYNTAAAAQRISDMVTESMINLLTKGNDRFVVSR